MRRGTQKLSTTWIPKNKRNKRSEHRNIKKSTQYRTDEAVNTSKPYQPHPIRPSSSFHRACPSTHHMLLSIPYFFVPASKECVVLRRGKKGVFLAMQMLAILVQWLFCPLLWGAPFLSARYVFVCLGSCCFKRCSLMAGFKDPRGPCVAYRASYAKFESF